MLDDIGSVFEQVGGMLAGSFWLLVAVLVLLMGWTVVQIVRLRRLTRSREAGADAPPPAPSRISRAFAGFWWRPVLVALGLAVWVIGAPLVPGAGLEIVGPVILAAGVVAVGAAGRRRRPEE
ncbi:hypothetical protein ACOKGD_12315 [Microbacterium phosphatis]|uniref:hypothetical protein n=1 Tax=Microbacterium phosphatis TaxID=3140248 RepID=UPI0031400A6D